MTFAIKLTGTCTDTTLPTLERDGLLSGSNDGVRFLWDAAFPYSYAGGPPAADALIRDISEHGDGKFARATADVVGFAGGGFDFSTMTATSGPTLQAVESPSNVWAGIQAEQEFMVVSYVKLPVLADWNVETSILPIFAGGNTGTGYSTEPDPVTILLKPGNVSARRQYAIGSQAEISVAPGLHYGLVTQVAFWREGGGANQVGLRLKSAAGSTLSLGTAATLNAADFSAVKARWGSVPPFTTYNLATHRTARNRRHYRGWVEDLSISGRNPETVLDADWLRVVARGVFS